MDLKIIGNMNYAASIVQIKNIIELQGCNNIVGTHIYGNHVIVSKDAKVGDIGLYFPLECSISSEFLKVNNLYREKTLNADVTKSGFFEDKGRVRAVKLRGNKSEGFFIPISSLQGLFELNSHEIYVQLQTEVGESFDTINDFKLCEKYIISNRQHGQGNGNKKGKKPKESKIIDNQFRFHESTAMLYKNLHRINPNDIISLTYKIHGCALCSSIILCNKKLSVFEKFLKLCKIKIQDTIYDNVYSSRTVVKNPDLNPNAQHYYKQDIWGEANKILLPYLKDGLTIYAEICGYLSDGSMIQKDYDYGCDIGKFEIYVYRLTYTSIPGQVYEFSCKQVQDWCKQNGLKAVPQLYYGYAKDFVPDYLKLANSIDDRDIDLWREKFREKIANDYLEKDCYICKNKVPAEGVVIRREINDFEAFKYKATAFYERETKLLDANETNIEDNQEETL